MEHQYDPRFAKAAATGYGAGGAMPSVAGMIGTAGLNNAINKPELQTLADELEHLANRVLAIGQRAGNVADRVLGMQPEGTAGAGKACDPANGTIAALRVGLHLLRENLDLADHNLARLERL